jgi:hypothetical protein
MKKLEPLCTHKDNTAIILGFRQYRGKRVTKVGTCCKECETKCLNEIRKAGFGTNYWALTIVAATNERSIDLAREHQEFN